MTELVEARGSLPTDRSFRRAAVAPALVLGVAPVLAASMDVPLTFEGGARVVTVIVVTIGVAAAMLIGAAAGHVDPRPRSLLAGVAAAGAVGAAGSAAFWLQEWIIEPGIVGADAPAQWRHIAGVPLVFAIAAVLGAAIGLLVRNRRGATATVLALLVIGLVAQATPRVEEALRPWSPFANAIRFLAARVVPESDAHSDQGPWSSLAWFAGVASASLVVGLVVARRRAV